MSKTDGGPAFPVSDMRSATPKDLNEMAAMARGMSLRDHFATKAMQGLLAQSNGTALTSDVSIAAEYAYKMADAMIRARG